MLEKEQVSMEVINNFEKILEQNGTTLPEDVEEIKEEARMFSKELAKKLMKKLKLEELEEELKKAKEIKIYTHKMSKLESIVEKAQEWTEEAKAIKNTEVQMSELTRLLAEARKINVELDLFEDLKQRQNEASNLISQSEITSTAHDSRKTRSKQKRNLRKKLTKKDAELTLKKLEDLKVISPKIDALRDHLGKLIYFIVCNII